MKPGEERIVSLVVAAVPAVPLTPGMRAKKNMRTYEAPLSVVAKLKNKTTGSEKEQEIFIADFPWMTKHGTFIINGVERIVVPQLARSYGVFFEAIPHKGKNYFAAKIIPSRGVWIEIESDPDGGIYVKIDRKRRFPVTSLLRVLGAKTDKEILAQFKDAATQAAITATLEHDSAKTPAEAYVEIYRRLRDGDIATPDTAADHVSALLSSERYDLSRVGRFHFNRRFELPTNRLVDAALMANPKANRTEQTEYLRRFPCAQRAYPPGA